jgi:hypothetical protein
LGTRRSATSTPSLIDLLDAAVDRAIEGDRGEPPGAELLGHAPAGVEGRRADAQRLGRADGEPRGGGGEVDLAGLGKHGQEQPLALRAPAGEPLAGGFEGNAVEGHRGEGRVSGSAPPPPARLRSPSPRQAGGGLGGSRSVGQAMSCSGSGTSDRRGPPTSSAASATCSNFFLALHQSSNSSTVISFGTRLPMNLLLMM